MLRSNETKAKSGFRALESKELSLVSGGFDDGGLGGGGPGPSMTEEDIQFQMMLSGMSNFERSQYLGELARMGALPTAMGGSENHIVVTAERGSGHTFNLSDPSSALGDLVMQDLRDQILDPMSDINNLLNQMQSDSEILDGSEMGFDWFPSESQVELIDNDGDGAADEIVVTYDLEQARTWVAFAESATYWTQLYFKSSVTAMGAQVGLNAFLAQKLGIEVGVAALAPALSAEALSQMSSEQLKDYWLDYAKGVNLKPAEFPLENLGNNPVPFIPGWP